MEKQVKEFVAEKVKELMAAPSCCAEAKKPVRTGWMPLEQRKKWSRQSVFLQSLKQTLCR